MTDRLLPDGLDAYWADWCGFAGAHVSLGRGDEGAPPWTADVGDARTLRQPLSVVQ